MSDVRYGAEEREDMKTAFLSVCAKLGIPEAMHIRAGGTTAELHEKRKVMRRASNQIRASMGSDPSEEMVQALHHVGTTIAKIEVMIDKLGGAHAQHGELSADEWRTPSGDRLQILRNAEQFRAHYDRRAQDTGQTDRSIGLDEFVRGIAGMKVSPDVRNALSVGTDTAGGFSVPSIVMPQILEAMVPASSLLQAGVGIVPLEQGAKTYTTAVVNAIPTAAWRSEGGAVGESEPTFRGVVATPRSLSFRFKVSRELLADSPNLQQALFVAIGQAFAKEFDRAGLRGTGTAPEPRGILNTSGVQAVGNGANGASIATTAYANFVAAAQALLAADTPMPTAAIMAPRSLTTLGGLLDTTNQPRARPEFLRPLKFISTSQIPVNLTVGTSTDCSELYIGDFSKMVFMMREQMSIQLLSELYAENGQVGFMCHLRGDVVLQYPAAFAVVTGVRA